MDDQPEIPQPTEADALEYHDVQPQTPALPPHPDDPRMYAHHLEDIDQRCESCDEVIVAACEACGALLAFEHIANHVLWHRHIAHIAAVSDTSHTAFARRVNAHVGPVTGPGAYGNGERP